MATPFGQKDRRLHGAKARRYEAHQLVMCLCKTGEHGLSPGRDFWKLQTIRRKVSSSRRSYSMIPFTKRTIIIQPQARRCMQKLGISEDEVLTAINEWESGEVDATDPQTAQTLAAYPETEAEIPAFYDSERDFSE